MSTEAASVFASDVVGFFSPLRIFPASEATLPDDFSFFATLSPPLCAATQRAQGYFSPLAGGLPRFIADFTASRQSPSIFNGFETFGMDHSTRRERPGQEHSALLLAETNW